MKEQRKEREGTREQEVCDQQDLLPLQAAKAQKLTRANIHLEL